MVVYVVTKLICGTSDFEDVQGVYSNLALAGRAVMQSLKDYSDDETTITFNYYEKPWGYYFEILAYTFGDTWLYGEMEIVRMTVNE